MNRFDAGSRALLLCAALLVAALTACAAPTTAPAPAATTANTGAPAGSAVTGNLSFVTKVPLPETATAEVNLVDVTPDKAGEPQVIASQTIQIGGRPSPIAFDVKYDAGKIQSDHTYGIAAKIVQGSEVFYVTTEPKLVITQGNPSSNVEVPLAPGSPEAPASS